MSEAFAEHYLYESVSVTAPAARMVVVLVWGDASAEGLDEGDIPDRAYQVLPVVAIRTSVCHTYQKEQLREDEPLERARTHRGLRRLGWRFASSGLYDEVLITDPDGGLVVIEELCRKHPGSAAEVFTCNWPPEEDESRLATQIATLARTAAENAKAALLEH